MKGLGDGNSNMDVRQDEMSQDITFLSRDFTAPLDGGESTIGGIYGTASSQLGESTSQSQLTADPHYSTRGYTVYNEQALHQLSPDNVDIAKAPILHAGFLVSFMVDARGGAMRGCRHSGVRVIIPPKTAQMPMRITCRYLRMDKLIHPPRLNDGEACASKIMEVGPAGAKFLGPVLIEVPHFASLRGQEREIIILSSDDGETWREHHIEADEKLVQSIIEQAKQTDGQDQDENQPDEFIGGQRITKIVTDEFPRYFAIISRVKREVHAVGPDGAIISSSVVPRVQATFTEGALTKRIKVDIQPKDQHERSISPIRDDEWVIVDESRMNTLEHGEYGPETRSIRSATPGSRPQSANAKRRSRFLLCFGGQGSVELLNEGTIDATRSGQDGLLASPDSAAGQPQHQQASEVSPEAVEIKERVIVKRHVICDVDPVDKVTTDDYNLGEPISLNSVIEQIVTEDYYIEKEPPFILNSEPITYGKRLTNQSAQTDSRLQQSAFKAAKKNKSKNKPPMAAPYSKQAKKQQRNSKKLSTNLATLDKDGQQQQLDGIKKTSLVGGDPERVSIIQDVITSDDHKWRTCTIQTDGDSVIVNHVSLVDDGYCSENGDLTKQGSFGMGIFKSSAAAKQKKHPKKQPVEKATKAKIKNKQKTSKQPAHDLASDQKTTTATIITTETGQKEVAFEDRLTSADINEREISLTPVPSAPPIEAGDTLKKQNDLELRPISPSSKEEKQRLKLEKQERLKREKEEKRLKKEQEEQAAKAEKLRKKQEKKFEKKQRAGQKSTSSSPVPIAGSPELDEQQSTMLVAPIISESTTVTTVTKVSDQTPVEVAPVVATKEPISIVSIVSEQHPSRQEHGKDLLRVSISEKLVEEIPSPTASSVDPEVKPRSDLVHGIDKPAEATTTTTTTTERVTVVQTPKASFDDDDQPEGDETEVELVMTSPRVVETDVTADVKKQSKDEKKRAKLEEEKAKKEAKLAKIKAKKEAKLAEAEVKKEAILKKKQEEAEVKRLKAESKQRQIAEKKRQIEAKKLAKSGKEQEESKEAPKLTEIFTKSTTAEEVRIMTLTDDNEILQQPVVTRSNDEKEGEVIVSVALPQEQKSITTLPGAVVLAVQPDETTGADEAKPKLEKTKIKVTKTKSDADQSPGFFSRLFRRSKRHAQPPTEVTTTEVRTAVGAPLAFVRDEDGSIRQAKPGDVVEPVSPVSVVSTQGGRDDSTLKDDHDELLSSVADNALTITEEDLGVHDLSSKNTITTVESSSTTTVTNKQPHESPITTTTVTTTTITKDNNEPARTTTTTTTYEDDDATEHVTSQASDFGKSDTAMAKPFDRHIIDIPSGDHNRDSSQPTSGTVAITGTATTPVTAGLSKKQLKHLDKRAKKEQERLAKEQAKLAKELKKVEAKQKKEQEELAKKQKKLEAKRLKEEAKLAKLEAKKSAKVAKKAANNKQDLEVASPVQVLGDGRGDSDQPAQDDSSDRVVESPKSGESDQKAADEDEPVHTFSTIEKTCEEVVGDDGTVTKLTKTTETKYTTLRHESVEVRERVVNVDDEGNVIVTEETVKRLEHPDSQESDAEPRNLVVEMEVPNAEYKSVFRQADGDGEPKLLTKKELKKRVKLNLKLIKKAKKRSKQEYRNAKKQAKVAEGEIEVAAEAARLAEKESKKAVKKAKEAEKIAKNAHKKMDKVDKKLAKKAKELAKKQKKIDEKAAKAQEKAAKKDKKTKDKKVTLKVEDIGEPVLQTSSKSIEVPLSIEMPVEQQQLRQELLEKQHQEQQQQQQPEQIHVVFHEKNLSEPDLVASSTYIQSDLERIQADSHDDDSLGDVQQVGHEQTVETVFPQVSTRLEHTHTEEISHVEQNTGDQASAAAGQDQERQVVSEAAPESAAGAAETGAEAATEAERAAEPTAGSKVQLESELSRTSSKASKASKSSKEKSSKSSSSSSSSSTDFSVEGAENKAEVKKLKKAQKKAAKRAAKEASKSEEVTQ